MKILKSTLLVALLALSVVGTASAVTITSVDDLNVEGMVIGVQTGTTSDLYAQDELDLATINGYDTILLAEQALEAGDVNVILGDKPVLDLYASDKEEWSVLTTFSEELFGLGVAEEQPDLLNALNAALDEIFNDNTATGYDAIYAEWFDDTPAVYDDGDGTYAYPAVGDLAADGLMKAIIDAGTIKFGTDPTYPPFEEKLTDGTYEGFDIDMMDEIAARLSAEYATTITVTIVDSDWDPIIPNLQAGEFDVILSAMTKTAERDQQIDFTRAYYGSIQAVLGPADG
ncbi:MAG: transporter substrate-binding domain-containing protein, partial [Candidatus Kariarchaeaceae archaeon]